MSSSSGDTATTDVYRIEEVLSDAEKEALERVLAASLTERECSILKLRWGLTDEKPLTLEKVGWRFGLTRERVRQLEGVALGKLSHPSIKAELKQAQ
jgi:RNA polymerase primary sigma factor